MLFADIRDLISVSDVMEDEDLHMGPNGGLIFCMESVFSFYSAITSLHCRFSFRFYQCFSLAFCVFLC